MRAMTASRVPLLGLDLLTARDSWFFDWFHLVRQAAARDADGGRIRFVPQGRAFRRFVALDVGVDGEGRITALSLGLDRRFVDDPDDGKFAKDIAQAFIRAALPRDVEAARRLADEIVPSAEDAEPLPEGTGPSRAYEVFMGVAPDQVLDLGAARLTLANLGVGGDVWLLLTIEKAIPNIS